MGLINGVDVGFSQYDGVPVDTELHHSSTDLAISTITSKGFTVYTWSNEKDSISTPNV